MSNWTKDMPKEEGCFWFFGEPFWGVMNRPPKEYFKPKMYVVQVMSLPNDFMYVTDGAFMNSKCHGLWNTEKIILPENPSLDLPESNG